MKRKLFVKSSIFQSILRVGLGKAKRIKESATLIIVLVAIVTGMAVHAYQSTSKANTSNGSSSQADSNTASNTSTSGKSEHDSPQPSIDDFNDLISEARDSVVKIESYGCGDITFDGTGFVADSDLVVTNAHVIAGTNSINVIDGNGSHAAVPIMFDPVFDLAVLRVSNLAGNPLELSVPDSIVSVAGMHNGDHGVVLGYPSGEGFKAELATIRDELVASSYDIYGKPIDGLNAFEVIVNVVPGNSGSPLVQQDGHVTGIVHSRSDIESGVGYVLPTKQFFDEILQAKKLYNRVSTQVCVPDGV